MLAHILGDLQNMSKENQSIILHIHSLSTDSLSLAHSPKANISQQKKISIIYDTLKRYVYIYLWENIWCNRFFMCKRSDKTLSYEVHFLINTTSETSKVNKMMHTRMDRWRKKQVFPSHFFILSRFSSLFISRWN